MSLITENNALAEEVIGKIVEVLGREHRTAQAANETGEARAILHVAHAFANELAAARPDFDRLRFIREITEHGHDGRGDRVRIDRRGDFAGQPESDEVRPVRPTAGTVRRKEQRLTDPSVALRAPLGESLHETQRTLGSLSPAAVDGQRVAAVRDLRDLGYGRVATLPLVRG